MLLQPGQVHLHRECSTLQSLPKREAGLLFKALIFMFDSRYAPKPKHCKCLADVCGPSQVSLCGKLCKCMLQFLPSQHSIAASPHDFIFFNAHGESSITGHYYP